LPQNFKFFLETFDFLLLWRQGHSALTWKGEGTLLCGLFAPSGQRGEADSEVSGDSTRADIFPVGQFDGLAFEFGGVGLPGRHGVASYGEA